jgi:cytochrome c-type biogenesis protein CcmH
MSLWPVLAAMTALVLALVLLPLLRRPRAVAARREHDLSVYRAQLSELEREAERGLLGPEEAKAARLEIERRMLAADAEDRSEAAPAAGPGHRRWAVALVLLVALPALSVTLYGRLGRPDLPATLVAGRSERAGAEDGAAGAPRLPPVATMIERLEERVAADPEDREGWLRLGRAYELSENPAKAAEAFGRAVALDGGDAELQAAFAEAQILAAEGVVTPKARSALERALALEPGNPRARFYQGLALLQRGERSQALELWAGLIGDTPADAPYLAVLRARATALAEELGRDAAEVLPEPAPAAMADARGPGSEPMDAAQEGASEEQAEQIRGMVEGLAARLAEQPDDAQGWRMLARSYGVLGERAKAAEAARRAASLLPEDPGAQIAYAEALLALESQDVPLSATAVDQLERVVALDADNAEALFWLGRAAAERGEAAQAAAYWRKILAQLPADAPQRAQLQALIDRLGAGE